MRLLLTHPVHLDVREQNENSKQHIYNNFSNDSEVKFIVY